MPRSVSLLAVAASLFLVACGGGSGGRSPSEPNPGPNPGGPVSLDGAWTGTISVNGQGNCSVTLDLQKDQQVYVGDWRAECAGGQRGDGIVVVNLILGNQALVSALPLRTQSIFQGCGWASLALRTGDRISGDWSTPQGCGPGELRGGIELAKRP